MLHNLRMSKNQPNNEKTQEKPEGTEKPNPPASNPASDTTEGQPSTVMNQPSGQSDESSLKAGSEEPTHFDELLNGAEVSGPIAGNGDIAPEKSHVLSEAEFIEMYAELFGMAADGTGFKSLEIKPEDRKSLAAMHRRAKASKWFKWMLTPGGPVMMDWILIGRFVGSKAQGVAAEMQAKQGAQQPAGQAESNIPSYNMRGTVQ